MKASDQGGKSWHMPLAACLIYINERVRFLLSVRELNIPYLETLGICCLCWFKRGIFAFGQYFGLSTSVLFYK